MEFAQKMKLLLEKEGISQKEFAHRVNMNYAHANKFFTGRNPNMEFLEKVMLVFPKVNLNWLLIPEQDEKVPDMLQEQGERYQNDTKAMAYIEEIEQNLSKLKSVLSQT